MSRPSCVSDSQRGAKSCASIAVVTRRVRQLVQRVYCSSDDRLRYLCDGLSSDSWMGARRGGGRLCVVANALPALRWLQNFTPVDRLVPVSRVGRFRCLSRRSPGDGEVASPLPYGSRTRATGSSASNWASTGSKSSPGKSATWYRRAAGSVVISVIPGSARDRRPRPHLPSGSPAVPTARCRPPSRR